MKEICYNNFKLHCPLRYYHTDLTDRFKTQNWEKEETFIINNYFSENDIVLEIGSCLGYTTCLLSKRCKKVYSFEANPELIDSLNLTKNKNNLDNVKFFYKYLTKDKGIKEFQTYDNIVAGSGDREDLKINNVRGWGNTLKKYNVDCMDITELKNFNDINSLVIDMEGGELKFLNNYQDFIKNNIKKINIELHQHLMSDSNFNKKCINILTKYCGLKLKYKEGCVYYFSK